METALSITALVTFAWTAKTVFGELRRRRRLHRNHEYLLQFLRRLARLDRRLCALVAELDERLTVGTGREGPDAWPRPLKGRLTYLDATIDELERTVAQVRAVEADGATERLRADVERLSRVIRDAASEYLSGTVCSYREGRGQPIYSAQAGSFAITPTLHGTQALLVRELPEEATMLFRTCWYRLQADSMAERYRALWPIEQHEVSHINTEAVWRTEPHPVG